MEKERESVCSGGSERQFKKKRVTVRCIIKDI